MMFQQLIKNDDDDIDKAGPMSRLALLTARCMVTIPAAEIHTLPPIPFYTFQWEWHISK